MKPEKEIDFANPVERNEGNGSMVGKEKELNRMEREEAENEQEISFEEKKLKTFAQVMDGFEYYIGGGLAVELIENDIIYRHGDVDMIIFENDLDKIRKNLQKSNFNLQKNPKFKGHDLNARNFSVDEESETLVREPSSGQEPLEIGLFVYKKDQERGTAQQLDEDGSINKEFPLSYFDRENQTVEYKGDKFIVADLRLVASLKAISERTKDVEDIKKIMPMLRSKFKEQELDEMRDVCKRNIKARDMASVKFMFENFLKTDQEINGENLYKYFSEGMGKSIAGIKDADYSEAARDFLAGIKEFSVKSKDPIDIAKDFILFASEKLKPVIDIQYKLIDRILN